MPVRWASFRTPPTSPGRSQPPPDGRWSSNSSRAGHQDDRSDVCRWDDAVLCSQRDAVFGPVPYPLRIDPLGLPCLAIGRSCLPRYLFLLLHALVHWVLLPDLHGSAPVIDLWTTQSFLVTTLFPALNCFRMAVPTAPLSSVPSSRLGPNLTAGPGPAYPILSGRSLSESRWRLRSATDGAP